jgi:hypothetical protein
MSAYECSEASGTLAVQLSMTYDARDSGRGSRMPARSVLMAIALSAWLVISMLVFVTVAYVGFIGVGVVGLLLWFLSTLVELNTDTPVGFGSIATPGFLARQIEVKEGQSPEERTASLADRFLALQSTRFYRYLGAALTVVGIGSFLLFRI